MDALIAENNQLNPLQLCQNLRERVRQP
jgi:hypothetical protein